VAGCAIRRPGSLFTRPTATVPIAAEPRALNRSHGLRFRVHVLSSRGEPQDDTSRIQGHGGLSASSAEPPSRMRRTRARARSTLRPAAWTARRISRRPKTSLLRRNCLGLGWSTKRNAKSLARTQGEPHRGSVGLIGGSLLRRRAGAVRSSNLLRDLKGQIEGSARGFAADHRGTLCLNTFESVAVRA
jgi:hypothetical protein